MPLGFTRLNERHARPNPNINFLKPLPGSDSEASLAYLSRVAAIFTPILRHHHLSVNCLEEFPPNREFWGRNFNNGEVIQLVLRSKGGAWLPARHVQMVMAHEVAHCVEMNHSKAFWKKRDEYAGELRELWRKGYTGDGVWGRGQAVEGTLGGREAIVDEDVPEHLCGGTYRTRGRKRRRGRQLTYQERKERRIKRKFGEGGISLGADEEVKSELEGGKQVKGKPRVAGSARGRELRAAAALSRVAQQIKEEDEPGVKAEEDSGSETDSELDEAEDGEAAVDADGKKILDEKGRGMVKVCEEEGIDSEDARRELAELYDADSRPGPSDAATTSVIKQEPVLDEGVSASLPRAHEAKPAGVRSAQRQVGLKPSTRKKTPPRTTLRTSTAKRQNGQKQEAKKICPVCSLENEKMASTCTACANVLNKRMVKGSWACKSLGCRSTGYVNTGDCGVCGACGAARVA